MEEVLGSIGMKACIRRSNVAQIDLIGEYLANSTHHMGLLLGAPGLTTRSKKLLGAKGIATRSKDATSANESVIST